MRRQLRPLLPELAAMYGIMPWHLEAMAPAEIEVFASALRDRAGRRAADERRIAELAQDRRVMIVHDPWAEGW